jgi:NADH pyrophosphatase NudC (nudix superfamily)
MVYKYCPDCGAECERKNFKSFKCVKCKHGFYDEPVISTGGLVKNSIGKYLFIKRNNDPGKGSLAVPGGYADNGESLEEGCAREIFEETGVRVSNVKYFKSYPYTIMIGEQAETGIGAFFTAESNDEGYMQVEEIQELMWLSKEEIDLDKIVLTDVKSFIKDYFLFPILKPE